MADFLVFQLYGSMVSWGDIAVGEHRPSLPHPTKSAITGLLAAALGIERDADDKHKQLSNHYGVAVCVRLNGELLRDYHTVQVPGGKREYASRRDELGLDKVKLNTILSQRDYRTDSFYQVAIWIQKGKAPYSLNELGSKLEAPHYMPYLGRKSCPLALPLSPKVLQGCTLPEAFERHSVDETDYFECQLEKHKHVSVYWEDGLSSECLGDLQATMVYPRRDKVTSRKRWQFEVRDEYYGGYQIDAADPATGDV